MSAVEIIDMVREKHEKEKKEEKKFTIRKLIEGGSIEKSLVEVYGYSFDEIKQDSRKKEFKEARQVGMFFNWIIKKSSKLSLREIGLIYGGKDHSTVLHAVKFVLRLLSLNHEREFREKVDAVSIRTGIDYKRFLECQEIKE